MMCCEIGFGLDLDFGYAMELVWLGFEFWIWYKIGFGLDLVLDLVLDNYSGYYEIVIDLNHTCDW